jgi:hypothetical protein
MTAPDHAHPRHRLLPLLLVLALATLTGCLGDSTNLRLEAILDEAVVSPDFRVRSYIPKDMNTADLYLSDIPTERLLDPSDSLADAVGSIVHIHLFLVPIAGSTPIDSTACNATVRHVVLAGPRGPALDRPAVGVYGGGGFLLPDDTPGARSFSGDLFDATMKLTHATPGFIDRLGASRMRGEFAVRRDDALSAALADRLADLLASAQPIPAPNTSTDDPANAPPLEIITPDDGVGDGEGAGSGGEAGENGNPSPARQRSEGDT